MCRFRAQRLALLLLLGAALPAAAQGPDPEILRTVERFFDAMRARDTTALRALVDSSARLVSTGATREGQPRMGATPIGAFLQAVAGAPDTLDERIYEPEVRQDGNLGTVWARYALFVGGRFSHCGYDAFWLFRSEQGWRVVAIADTRRREGCPPPT